MPLVFDRGKRRNGEIKKLMEKYQTRRNNGVKRGLRGRGGVHFAFIFFKRLHSECLDIIDSHGTDISFSWGR
jgi:hypothetical protein